MWTAAILAGGRARRLGGGDKAMLRIGAATVLERQLAVLRQVVDEILIIAGDRERYSRYGVPVIADLLAGAGALGGIYTAVTSAPTDRTLVVACDMPFLNTRFLRHLTEAGSASDWAVPRTPRGYEPLCATYSRRCAGLIRPQIERGELAVAAALIGAAGLSVRELGPEELAPFDPDGRLFFNINTADDYARAVVLESADTPNEGLRRS